MCCPNTVRLDGPLAVHREAFWLFLLERGYSPLSAVNQLRLLAHLSRWLVKIHRAPESFDHALLVSFVEERRAQKRACWNSMRALDVILDFFKTKQIINVDAMDVVDVRANRVVLNSYQSWMMREKAYVASTISKHIQVAERFLEHSFSIEVAAKVDSILPSHILDFVHSLHARHSVSTVRTMLSALRTFLRFLFLRNFIVRDLRGVIPAVACPSQASLPQTLQNAEVCRLLNSCDRRRKRGRRDYAILLLMLRLGLRRSDVAALTLEDIDWNCGELLVSGKNQREERLPLPDEVGKAIANYLRYVRPLTAQRQVFIALIAPFHALNAKSVSAVVKTACERAGLGNGAGVRLRHTAASQMLNAGASLDEIAQVLRHRNCATTALYAKIDEGSLKELICEWPETRS